MVAFDYLKEQLTEFVKTFKNVKVNYEYDQLANLHTIEVLPQVVFDSDEFAIWECDFFERAYDAIPYEDISFISEDAYVGIEHIDWSIQGSDYAQGGLRLDDHITINESSEDVDTYKENSVDFNTMSPEFYDTYTAVEIESLDLDYTCKEYKDKIVLGSKEIVMSFDDSLLQAA